MYLLCGHMAMVRNAGVGLGFLNHRITSRIDGVFDCAKEITLEVGLKDIEQSISRMKVLHQCDAMASPISLIRDAYNDSQPAQLQFRAEQSIFRRSIIERLPFLRQNKINRIVAYPGFVNRPHIGHLDLPQHGFWSCGHDLCVNAVVVLPLAEGRLKINYNLPHSLNQYDTHDCVFIRRYRQFVVTALVSVASHQCFGQEPARLQTSPS